MPEFQRDPAALSDLYIRSSRGQLVPLRAVAKIGRGGRSVDGESFRPIPSVTISFNLAPGVPLGTAVDCRAQDAGGECICRRH